MIIAQISVNRFFVNVTALPILKSAGGIGSSFKKKMLSVFSTISKQYSISGIKRNLYPIGCRRINSAKNRNVYMNAKAKSSGN